jgi:hypothetical protein
VTYSQTLTATGGKTSYTWSRTAGSLPAGLSLSTAGVISGTPTSAGTSSFTLQVKDSNNATATKALAITIVPPVNVTSATLPSGAVGSAYNQTLVASDGKSPYTWSIIDGILPPGLSLNSATGVTTGTPATAGITSLTVQVKDANNKTATGYIST